MIQVFCARRGSGKTKRLIELANHQQISAKGDAVYIDDDSRPMLQLARGIRFVDTNEYRVDDCQSFYGMLCGIISSNYDIENIYIDGVLNIVSCGIKDTAYLFKKIYDLSNKYNFNVYMNINYAEEEIPEFIKEYVA